MYNHWSSFCQYTPRHFLTFALMFQVQHLSVHFGGEPLFNNASFLINKTDKIGLVGRNGAGKSTLMRVLAGTQNYEQGQVIVPKEARVGYLPQEFQGETHRTVLDETRMAFQELWTLEAEVDQLVKEMSERENYSSQAYMDLIERYNEKEHQLRMAGGGKLEKQIERVLKGMGFEQEDLESKVHTLSGGWQMRIELAKLLLRAPDLILLDEPTNHLDIESIRWVEQFLKEYNGAVMLVSHDRAFLDNITNKTIEIAQGRIIDYPVPFSQYVKQREERKAQQAAAKKNQDREVERLQRNIEKFRGKPNKASFVESLKKKLNKMEQIEVEQDDTSTMTIRFPEAKRAGKITGKARHISKSYGNHQVLNDISFDIYRGDRISFVGKNGMGKSTLMRILAGELDYEGSFEFGHNVQFGYYAQHQSDKLQGDNNLLEEMERNAPPEQTSNIRNILGAFLFSDEDVYKKVKVLSGGEKARLALAKMMLHPFNFLLMDEPTNHLDMLSKEVLKNALMNFDGTLIIVSHDRNFLDGLTYKTYEFRADGIQEHLGDINVFLQNREVESFREWEADHKDNDQTEVQSPASNTSKEDKKNRHERRKTLQKEIKSLKNQVNKHEKNIADLEEKVQEREKRLKDPDEYKKLMNDQQFFQDYEALKKEHEEQMEKWEQAAADLEQKQKEMEKIREEEVQSK